MQSARSPATQMSMPAGHCARASKAQFSHQGSGHTTICVGSCASHPTRSGPKTTLCNADAAQQ